MSVPGGNLDGDVPSPIDLRDLRDASEWVADADLKRPWRVQLRGAFVELLRSSAPPPRRVLELGPGPGLLAETILQACTLENYRREPAVRWDANVYVPDPDALAAEFASRNVEFSEPLKDTDDGLRGFELKDSDGYVLFFGRTRP